MGAQQPPSPAGPLASPPPRSRRFCGLRQGPHGSAGGRGRARGEKQARSWGLLGEREAEGEDGLPERPGFMGQTLTCQ